jgi:hypothetical protein
MNQSMQGLFFISGQTSEPALNSFRRKK